MHYVYVLQSKKDKSLYIGFSSNLKERLRQHAAGSVSSTKYKIPYSLIYYEAYLHKDDAMGREKFLKSGGGWKYIKKQLRHYLEESL